jgi:hypothetical protein
VDFGIVKSIWRAHLRGLMAMAAIKVIELGRRKEELGD